MNSIDTGRRQALKTGGSLPWSSPPSVRVLPASAFADWNKAAFDAKSLNDVVKAGGSAEKIGDIAITAPDIAENGAVVPIAVASKIAGTQSIAILVEKTRTRCQHSSTFRRAPKPTSAPA